MDLYESLPQPILAHRVFDHGLDLKDQEVLGPAQIQKAPIQPDLRVGLLDARDIDRQQTVRGTVDRELADTDLDATGFDNRVGNNRAGYRNGGLPCQDGDPVIEDSCFRRALHRGLCEPRGIAEDEKLDALLVPDRLD